MTKKKKCLAHFGTGYDARFKHHTHMAYWRPQKNQSSSTGDAPNIRMINKENDGRPCGFGFECCKISLEIRHLNLNSFNSKHRSTLGGPEKKWKGSRGSKKNDSKEGIPIHPKDFILPRFALFDFKKNAPLENYRRVCGGNFIFVTLLSNEICELLQINGLVAAVCPKKRNHRTRTSQHFATNEGEKKHR